MVLLCTILTEPASAQQPGAQTFFWHTRPTTAGGWMILTNCGIYAESATISGPAGGRVVADWGALTDVGAHGAVGGSLFISYDITDGLIVGPAVRYRR